MLESIFTHSRKTLNFAADFKTRSDTRDDPARKLLRNSMIDLIASVPIFDQLAKTTKTSQKLLFSYNQTNLHP